MDKLRSVDPVQLGDNQINDWARFEQDFNILLLANELDEKSTKVKASILLSLVGKPLKLEVQKWKLEAATLENYEALKTKIREELQPSANITYATFRFPLRVRLPGEDMDAYIAAKQELAQACKFSGQLNGHTIEDRMVKDDVLLNLPDSDFQTYLLRDEKLTLQSLQDNIKMNEESRKQVQNIQAGKHSEQSQTACYDVHRISIKKHRRQRKPPILTRSRELKVHGWRQLHREPFNHPINGFISIPVQVQKLEVPVSPTFVKLLSLRGTPWSHQ